jgi:hypothetical protein
LDCHSRVGNQWSIIAKSLPGRSQVRVRDRYKKLCRNGKVSLEDVDEDVKPIIRQSKPLPSTQRTTAFTRYDNEALNHLDLCFVLCGMRNQVVGPMVPIVPVTDPAMYHETEYPMSPQMALGHAATEAYQKASVLGQMDHGQMDHGQMGQMQMNQMQINQMQMNQMQMGQMQMGQMTPEHYQEAPITTGATTSHWS